MNRINKLFSTLKDKNRKGLVSYITAGDPNLDLTLPILHKLVASGVDALEVGVAFSDPVADGTTIQGAHQRALKSGSNLNTTLEIIGAFRQTDKITPIVLMSYINPIENMGYDQFIEKAAAVGIDGIILVDVPIEEGDALITVMRAKGIAPIFLVAPTTKEERLKQIAEQARGFIYSISLKGVTGANLVDSEHVARQVKVIREYSELPVAVGFGIRDGASAAAVAKHADAVIVGSAFVSIIENHLHDKDKLLSEIAKFATSVREALDSSLEVA